MIRLTVRRRLVLLLMIVSLVPLATASVIWLLSSQAQLRKDAAAQQSLLVKSAADDVNYFINDKVNAAIINSQSPGIQNIQLPVAQTELQTYLKQDSDLIQATLVDASGHQRLLVNRSSTSTQAVDVSSTDAFRVVTFLGGEDYISPVSFDAQHNPIVTISVPLTSYASIQSGNYLSTSEPGVILTPSSIKGALIVKVSLNTLWSSVLDYKLGQSGYAYVVDNQGTLLAYPTSQFSAQHTNLAKVAEVKTAINETLIPGAAIPAPEPHQTVSETGVKVLSSHYQVARTGWIVVAEEPINSVYAPVRNIVRISVIFFVLSYLVGFGFILFTVRGFLKPIRALSDGANQVASGNLGFRIPVLRRDEFGLLAQTFNNMAAKISGDIAKLQDLDQMKNEFIAIASHNLRTPLSVINGSIDMLRDDTASPETQEIFDAIKKSSRELSDFSEDLLAISTIEARTTNLKLSTVSIADLLKPLQTPFDVKAAEKDVHLQWSIPEPAYMVTVSPVHIRSAVANLLTNALEFTPVNGQVTCDCTVHPNKDFEIRVSDTGTGIEPAEMDKLFTKFHRGTDTLRYDHPGTGIGLYLTLRLIEAHHGRITVRSQVGKGSTFIITLPLSDAAV